MPEIHVRCTAKDHYFLGKLISVTEDYEPVQFFGTVVECSSGSGDRRLLIDDDAYDPYYGGAGCSETSSGSGGGSGSGTQFGPGDSTDGETVDWKTGVGNGGSSVCGSKAIVEYVCIDILTEDGWVEWSCGFATTC